MWQARQEQRISLPSLSQRHLRWKIGDPDVAPEVYVVPSSTLRPLIYNAPGGRKLVTYSTIKEKGGHYRNNWGLLKRA